MTFEFHDFLNMSVAWITSSSLPKTGEKLDFPAATPWDQRKAHAERVKGLLYLHGCPPPLQTVSIVKDRFALVLKKRSSYYAIR